MEEDRHVSHRPHAAQDIVPGSRWVAMNGPGIATVIEAVEGYVTFTSFDGAVAARETLHHGIFRRAYAPPYDGRRLRSWFSMCVTNLQAFHVFWLNGKPYARTARRSVADAFKPGRGRGGAVPQGATHIGTYTDPCTPDTFFSDLNDAIVSATRRQSAAA